MVKDVSPGPAWSFPLSLTDLDGTLFFAAIGTHGSELWSSDGTRAGTVMVKDINPGRDWSLSWTPELAPVGGALYFAADDGTHGEELWKTDGTEAGTVLVKDLYRGTKGSSPTWITDSGGAAFFSATNPSTGRELWKSGG